MQNFRKHIIIDTLLTLTLILCLCALVTTGHLLYAGLAVAVLAMDYFFARRFWGRYRFNRFFR